MEKVLMETKARDRITERGKEDRRPTGMTRVKILEMKIGVERR